MRDTREHIRTWHQDEFTLFLYDTNTTDRYGKYRLAYELYYEDEKIFEGDDFCCSPLHAIDSDECLGSLLTFLSLRPGDTDAEYFDDYSPQQMDFAMEHGERLSWHAFELVAVERSFD